MSGMTGFAHLSDYILLANYYKICSIHDTLEFLTDHLLVKSQSAVFFSFCKLGHKITISHVGSTVA